MSTNVGKQTVLPILTGPLQSQDGAPFGIMRWIDSS